MKEPTNLPLEEPIIMNPRDFDNVYATTTAGGTYHTILCHAKRQDNLVLMGRGMAEIIWGKEPCLRCVADDFGHRDFGYLAG